MKKILSTFIIWCIWLISFCSAYDTYDFSSCTRYYCALNTTNTYNWTYCIVLWQDSVWNSVGAFSAIYFDNSNTSSSFDWSSWPNFVSSYVPFWTNRTTDIFLGCFNNNWFTNYSKIHSYTSSNNIRNKLVYIYSLSEYLSTFYPCQECQDCPSCPSCPSVDTGAILSWYVLVSSIDSNYCTDNNLCPSSWTWSCEEWNWNRSALYINDIQHPWSALINITIPEELQRNYTGDEEEMNIDVEWYWYDQEKMQQLVNTQYYTPTPEDMGNLVGKIADFLPLLAIMLLVIRTWYLIKKVF